MSLGSPIPVRFAISADKRLKAIAAKNEINKSALIRLAVDNFLREIEHSGSIQFTKFIEDPGAEPLAAEEGASRTIKTAPGRPASYKERRR